MWVSGTWAHVPAPCINVCSFCIEHQVLFHSFISARPVRLQSSFCLRLRIIRIVDTRGYFNTLADLQSPSVDISHQTPVHVTLSHLKMNLRLIQPLSERLTHTCSRGTPLRKGGTCTLMAFPYVHHRADSPQMHCYTLETSYRYIKRPGTTPYLLLPKCRP